VIGLAVFAVGVDATDRDHDRGRGSSSHHSYDKHHHHSGHHDWDDDDDHDCSHNDICGGLRLTGAVFTTNEDGNVVNGNVYEDAVEVFLNGGPIVPKGSAGSKKTDSKDQKSKDNNTNGKNGKNQKDDGRGSHGYVKPQPAGLPDGRYYFQVTDPSGRTLLSSDPVEDRQFDVENGYIQNVYGSPSHYYGILTDPFPPDFSHKVVQLAPFNSTPNRGKEYKVWITPVAAYRPGRGFHGFLPTCSKTDNFKARRNDGSSGGGGQEDSIEVTFKGTTYYDENLSHALDRTEKPYPGVMIVVYEVFPDGSLSQDPKDAKKSDNNGVWELKVYPENPTKYLIRAWTVEGPSSDFAYLIPTTPPSAEYSLTAMPSSDLTVQIDSFAFGIVPSKDIPDDGITPPGFPLTDQVYMGLDTSGIPYFKTLGDLNLPDGWTTENGFLIVGVLQASSGQE
jgi:hypothetical protein